MCRRMSHTVIQWWRVSFETPWEAIAIYSGNRIGPLGSNFSNSFHRVPLEFALDSFWQQDITPFCQVLPCLPYKGKTTMVGCIAAEALWPNGTLNRKAWIVMLDTFFPYSDMFRHRHLICCRTWKRHVVAVINQSSTITLTPRLQTSTNRCPHVAPWRGAIAWRCSI